MREVYSFPCDTETVKVIISQIKDSPFAPYIDDEIYNELTKYLISTVSGTNKR